MNIKSLTMKDINGLETPCQYKSAYDHSKWVMTGKSSVPWTCVGDINRGVSPICPRLFCFILFYDWFIRLGRNKHIMILVFSNKTRWRNGVHRFDIGMESVQEACVGRWKMQKVVLNYYFIFAWNIQRCSCPLTFRGYVFGFWIVIYFKTFSNDSHLNNDVKRI